MTCSRTNALLAILVLLVLACAGATLNAAQRPNIVVILVDDMGFSDIGCYGSEIPTPNLDALAAERPAVHPVLQHRPLLPHARVAADRPVSAPSRRRPHDRRQRRARLSWAGSTTRCVTIAEVLKPAGYFTAMTGKWHVGQNLGVTPWGRGFDRSLNAAAGGFYFPESSRGEAVPQRRGHRQRRPASAEGLVQHRPVDHLRIEVHRRGARGEEAVLPPPRATTRRTSRLQAPAEEIAKFRGKYKHGWDALRDAAHPRGNANWASSIPPGSRRRARTRSAQWEQLTPEEQDRFDHLMAVYAAVVHRMDQAVGDLVAGLKQRGVLDNTLILFMSDNGGNAEVRPRRHDRGRPDNAPRPIGSAAKAGPSWKTRRSATTSTTTTRAASPRR